MVEQNDRMLVLVCCDDNNVPVSTTTAYWLALGSTFEGEAMSCERNENIWDIREDIRTYVVEKCYENIVRLRSLRVN